MGGLNYHYFVPKLFRWSNMNLPGQWIFRVGQLEANANIEQPDVFDGKV